jgi:hypothetical protein
MFSIQSAFASVTAKADTWQMMGYRMDVNLSKVQNLDADEFSIIWYWDDGEWRAFSKDPTTLEAINRLGLYGDSLKDNQGFWVKAKQDFKVLPYTQEASFLPNKKGWHLLSLGSGIVQSDYMPPNIGIVYMYRNNNWEYIKQDANKNILKSKDYLTNYGNEGFWIYNIDDTNETYPFNNYYEEGSNDTFSNKTFSFDGKTITLDQNGTVISNIAEINGGKWKGYSFTDYHIAFGVKKGDKRYTYSGMMAWDPTYGYPLGYYNLDAIVANTFQILPNGIEEVLDSNRTDFYNQNITINISDYNRSKVLDTSVKDALDTLKNIADFGDSDARTKLDDIKASLSSSSSKDAKVVLALVNFVEILDTDVVKNSFLANTQSLDINSFASTIIPDDNATIELVKTMTDYEGNATALMQDLSDRLKANADSLASLSLDENYYYEYENAKLNFVDIKELRMAMLALSFKLQFLASYELGNDTWLKPITEDLGYMVVEYVKAGIDPVAFLNSGKFFVNPDQAKLTHAKSLLREFLGLYYDFLNSDNYAREGMNIAGRDLDTRNLKRNIKLALDNLDGIRDSINILDDRVEWGDYNPETQSQNTTHKYFSRVFDLNALFDTSTAISINDFGIFSYSGANGTYDTEMSKRNNSPTASDGTNLVDDIKSSTTFSTPNHINNFFKSYKDGDLEYTGSSLLNEIFGTN